MGDFVAKSKKFTLKDFKIRFKKNKWLSKKIPKSKSPLDDNCSLIKAAWMLKEHPDKNLATDFYFKEFWIQVQHYFDLRTTDSHKAFNLLKKLSKYKISLDKRESDVANWLVINGIEFNADDTKELILETFKNNHMAESTPPSAKKMVNCYISDNVARKILLGVQREKGFSFDCCNFSSFKICKDFKKDFVCKDGCEKGCWNKLNFVKEIFSNMDFLNTKKESDFFFKGRLIPLSKSGSNIILSPGDIRPIIIVSYIIKVLESILLEPLKEYVNHKMIKSQVGATDGGEVNQNILLLLDSIYKIKMIDVVAGFVLFLDLKDAYGSLDWVILQELLKLKEILTENQINILNNIMEWIKITINGKDGIETTKGVYQGLKTSPFIFVIYIEALLIIILQKFIEKYGSEEIANIKCQQLFYIDDGAFVVRTFEDLDLLIEAIDEGCKKLKLTLNHSKSGLMIINKTKLKYNGVVKEINKTKKYKGFPITNEYKYLGVVIDKDLRFKTMIDNYVKKTKSIAGRLFPITSQGDFNERSFLFSVLNGPFVDQLW